MAACKQYAVPCLHRMNGEDTYHSNTLAPNKNTLQLKRFTEGKGTVTHNNNNAGGNTQKKDIKRVE